MAGVLGSFWSVQSADPETLVLRIQKLISSGETRQAAALMEQEVRKESDPERLRQHHRRLGDLYTDLLEIEKAVSHYDLLIEGSPDEGSIYWRKARVVGMEPNRWHEAMSLVELSILKGFIHADAYNLRGFLHRLACEKASDPASRTNQFVEGLRSYEIALELDPRNPTAWGNTGDLLFDFGRYGESAEAYARLLEIDPTSLPALANLARALLRLGKLDPAIEALRSVEERFDRMRPPCRTPHEFGSWMISRASAQRSLIEAYELQNRKSERRTALEKLVKMTDPVGNQDWKSGLLEQWRAEAIDRVQQLDAQARLLRSGE